MIRSEDPLSLPARPADPPPVGFPVIASLAPLAAAGVIWAITGSPFALVFAVLSPLIAVAGMLDGRRANARRLRKEAAAYAAAVQALRTGVSERHDGLRLAAWQRTPSAGSILSGRVETGRWQHSNDALVALGSGPAASGVRLDGAADPVDHRELRDWAATLAEAPITADVRGGIGIVGPLALTRAVARGLVVQLCFALPPGRVGLLAPAAPAWAWTAALPHTDAGSAPRQIEVVEARARAPAAPDGTRLLIALAAASDDLPPGCDTIARIHGPGRAHIVRSPVHAWASEFRPELVAVEQAAFFAARLRDRALEAGLAAQGRPVPGAVALTDLHRRGSVRASGPTRSLDCPIGRGEQGEVTLDLVADGPHAVVGGTTGSGKSELLVTWVASMAAAYPPEQVTFLLVDFKGGAAFRPLLALPHCVGLITDLDERHAARALQSLAAELRFRERALVRAEVRDIGDARAAGALPRLVIVVDEFATMLGAFPELHALFVDIAARGRSLGVHLILCTQRPAGVVRDALLANCSLRLSLRVNNRADSAAVIGTDAAAALSPAAPGRCLVQAGAGGVVLCQVATTAAGDIEAIVAATPAVPARRRPWLDPLPGRVTERDLRAAEEAVSAASTEDARGHRGPGYRLGLLDEPEHQRYRVATWAPQTDGHLLVVGGPRSGKSTLLASLAAQPHDACRFEWVAADVEATWDALQRARARLDAGRDGDGRGLLLLLDDFDSVCARWDADYRAAGIDLLTGLLRDGRPAGLHLVIAVQRLAGALQALPELCQDGLLLRLPNLQEHLLAGGTAGLFSGALPPGGGSWRGSRIQLLAPGPTAPALAAAGGVVPELVLDPARPLLMVSGTPARSAAVLRSARDGGVTVVEIAGSAGGADRRLDVTDAAGGTVLVGDADSWQAQWALLGALRAQADMVFDGCTLADYRLVSRRRDLPPPLAPGRGHAWLLRPDGTVTRTALSRQP